MYREIPCPEATARTILSFPKVLKPSEVFTPQPKTEPVVPSGRYAAMSRNIPATWKWPPSNSWRSRIVVSGAGAFGWSVNSWSLEEDVGTGLFDGKMQGRAGTKCESIAELRIANIYQPVGPWKSNVSAMHPGP